METSSHHEVRIAYLFTSPREALIERVKRSKDAETSLLGLLHMPDADYFTIAPTSLRQLLFIQKLLRYDVIITQDHLPLGYFVSLYARIFHRTTRWFYVSMTSSTLLRRHTQHPVRLFLLKTFWSSYTRILCLSSGQMEDFIRIGIPRDRLIFVPFGVDAHFFRPADAAQEENLVVSGGRDAGRDYATLLRAAALVPHPFVVFAGRENIPPDMRIPKNVTIRYEIPLTDIRDLYARASVAVVVSKEEYAQGGSDCSGQTVILDALAARKAVIATRRSWVVDYFTPGEDLIVVEPGNPEALARAISELMQDPERRRRLAASGHEKVMKQYTTAVFARRLLEVIRSLV